jgi:hypothetical protein
MSGYGEETKLRTGGEILTIRIPEELMDLIKAFCASNDVSLEQYAVDALSEKLSRWKE